jgi:outer membrane receptor protein involved in Fe transport
MQRKRTLLMSGFLLGCASLAQAQQQQAEPSGEDIEEFVVTGSYLPRLSQFDAPAPLTTVTRENLQALGANEIGDVIEDLTINTGSQNNPDAFTQNFSTGTSNINLRGLGVSSTLVLINGRRQTQSAVATDRGENFVDTSSLPPMIVFDRIEILKDGATALYGSEAVAGVANFISRIGFTGLDLEVGIQAVSGYPTEDKEISVLWGGGGEATHVLVAASYLDRDPLTTYDRRLSRQADDLSQAGNPGSFLVPSIPANPTYALIWTSAFDSNRNGVADALEPRLGLPPVPGAQLPVFGDPDCATIAAQDSSVVPAFAATIPTPIGPIPIGLCQFDFGRYYSIVPEEERASAYVELTHDFGESLRLRVEAHGADNEAARNNSPSFPFAQFPTVPATHPDNPYGTSVNFIGRVAGAGAVASPSIHESDTTRFAASLAGDFGENWGWNFGITDSTNDFAVTAEDVLIDRFGLAIRGLGGPACNPTTGTPGAGNCMYFNPWGSALTGTGTRNSPALFEDIFGDFSYDAESELTTIDGFVTGLFGEFRRNPIGVALGAQVRSEEIAYDYDPNSNSGNFFFFAANPDFVGDRDVEAVFGEMVFPFGDAWEIQLAARYEDYGDGLDSADPKVNVLWRPTTDLSIRGTIGTSFRAPSLSQEFGVQTTLAELIDPTVGVAQFFPVRAQPNPNGERLNPEEADVITVGFSWAIGDAIELGLDYWSFDYDQVIIQQDPQALLNAAALGNPQAQAQVIRDPLSGLLLRVDSYYTNASTLETDGFDFSIAYAPELADGGRLRLGLEGTLMTSYDIEDPQAGSVDGLGRRNFANFATSTPELRANVFANWSLGDHAINAYVRYIDSYIDDEVDIGQGPAFYTTIDDYVTVDLQYAVRLPAERSPLLSFGAINVLDEDPPYVATNGGYDSKVHDPRGRLLYARATFEF